MKLSLDLVPRTCWFSNLRSELPRAVWDRLRREQYALAGHRCEVCGVGGRIECHERWEYLRSAEDRVQLLVGLIALCRACHEVKHFGLAQHRGRFAEALAHYVDINGVDPATGELEIAAEFDEWAARSRESWVLNVAWLREKGVDVAELTRAAKERLDDVEAGSGAATRKIFKDMTTSLGGPTPMGSIRLAVIHPCGHAEGIQVKDPICVEDDVERDHYRVRLQLLKDSPCAFCLDDSDPVEAEAVETKPKRRPKRAVEDHQGRTYDLLF